ncbi:ankyrin repeat-containing domain protein [Xylariaceae sp. FL1019]|nr:ankyrin repeat-containing domain protein [Xylariaceae sp. FL1019]
MSFGFGVGDFLAVLKLAHQLQKDFLEAPKEYKALAEDVRSLSIALQDAEISGSQLDDSHLTDFKQIVTSCKDLLQDLDKTLDKYKNLSHRSGTDSRQGIKSIWNRLKFEPADVRAIRSQISLKISGLRTFNDRLLADKIESLVQHQGNEVHKDLIDWISTVDMLAQQNDLVRRCQEGSRRWLFDSATYREWLSMNNMVLLCHGKLGTGKTYTMAMVAETLRTTLDARILTVYLYCSYRDRTQTVDGLLCTVLRGALEEATLDTEEVVASCMQLRRAKQRLSRQRAVSLLVKLFAKFSRVNLLVDALDELPVDVRLPFINDLLNLRRANTNTNLLLTTRDNFGIGQMFEREDRCMLLEVRASDIDIRQYLSENVDRLPKFVRNSSGLKNELIDLITNTSDGMFLLAELQLKSLTKILTLRKLRIELSQLSGGSNRYDKLYDEAMQRIRFQGPEAEQTALRTLLMVSCARRPLSTGELIHALALDEDCEELDADMIPEIDDVVSTCDGLVVVDNASDAVRLVHKSTQDYFQRNISRWFREAHKRVANICLRYMESAKLGCTGREPDLGTYSFFAYASENWGYHIQIKDTKDHPKTSRLDPLDGFDQQTYIAMTDRWGARQIAEDVSDVESNIIGACYSNRVSWVELLLTVRKYDINKNSQKTSDPIVFRACPDHMLLTIAVARGYTSMVKMLISHGADLNLRNARSQTPLMTAVDDGHVALVALLLEQPSTDPDVLSALQGREDGDDWASTTPFLAAVRIGNIELVRLLIEKSNRSARAWRGSGAVWLAASLGHCDILSELLKWSDIECDYYDLAWCYSPLAAAIRNAQVESALMLLPHAKPRRCEKCGQTAIYVALVSHQYELLQHLVRDNPSDVNNDASQEHLIRILYESGERCPGPEDYHVSPLMAAVVAKDLEGLRIILPYAKDKQESFPKQWRPIHEAAKAGDAEVLQLLLSTKDIEADPIDHDGRSPFLVAVELGQIEALKAFVRHRDGICFERQDNKERAATDYIFDPHLTNPSVLDAITPALHRQIAVKASEFLYQACGLSSKIHERLPPEDDSPCSPYDSEWDGPGSVVGTTPGSKIEYCVSRPYQDTGPFVRSLLNVPGVNPNQADSDGNTPLHLAVKNHQPAAVAALLIHPDIDLDVQDASGETAIFVAATNKSIQNSGAVSVDAAYSGEESEEGTFEECNICNETAFVTLVKDGRSSFFNKNGRSILSQVLVAGTTAMIQAVLDLTDLIHELGKTFKYNRSMLSTVMRNRRPDDTVALLFFRSPLSVLHIVDDYGRTPLYYVVESYFDMIDTIGLYFVAAKVDFTITGRKERSELSYAVRRGYIDGVRWLFGLGVIDVNLLDADGRSALLYAAYSDSIEMVRLLLD